MPTNLYGTGDNFDRDTSHVLPALIRKFHEGKVYGKPVVAWGTGSPRREFLHADDMADACIHLMTVGEDRLENLYSMDAPPLINIGTGQDLTIRELAQLVAEVTGYSGEIAWDTSKPDGTPRKILDISRLRHLGWQPSILLQDGVQAVYEWYQESAAIRQ
jgi:GDP-L-fucose synthase